MRFVKPKKALGQHFLNDIGVAERIVESLSPSQNVLEIGPGTGILTKILIKKKIDLKLVEIDKESVIKKINAYEISKEYIDNEKINLIYLDPPFKDKNINKLLRKILDLKIAHKSTLIIIHRNKKFKENFIEDFNVLREKKYGLSKIIFGKLLF